MVDDIVTATGKMGAALILSMFLFTFLWHLDASEKDYYKELDGYIDSGYAVYINGIEVDPEKIVIRNYDKKVIEVNNEQNEIYIAANK